MIQFFSVAFEFKWGKWERERDGDDITSDHWQRIKKFVVRRAKRYIEKYLCTKNNNIGLYTNPRLRSASFSALKCTSLWTAFKEKNIGWKRLVINRFTMKSKKTTSLFNLFHREKKNNWCIFAGISLRHEIYRTRSGDATQPERDFWIQMQNK